MPYIRSTYEYTKPRKTFGRQPLFQAGPAQMIDSIYPNKEDQKQYALRNPVHRFVQATKPQSEHDANTKQLVTHEQSMNHVEGGWPREVHIYNEDHVARYRRRVMHEENYVNTILNIAPVVQHYVNQNNAIEMYESYFANMEPQEPVEKCSAQIANVFRDQFQRPVSCIVWTQETNFKLAAAYSYRTDLSNLNKNNISPDCYIWDISRQIAPIHVIKPKISCWQIACSPEIPEVLIGGLENGTVNVFDIREGEKCVLSSSVYNSHKGPITSLLFTHSRTQTEFFSGSLDGLCFWWDARNLDEPLDVLSISYKLPPGETPNSNNAEGISSLEFNSNLPTRFLCGTDSGLVFNVNRMGREHAEMLYSRWNAHVGSVRAVQRSPCTLRMFLTCGDSSVRVWSEEVRTAPIIVTRPYKHQVMDASWAPLRYSSYMSICAGGYFYFWDFLRKYKDPVVTLQVAKTGLTKLTPHSEGHSVAIGDCQGDLHLLQLSEKMTEPGVRDKVLMFQLYTRETRREHILDNRLKEIRLKIRSDEEAAARTDADEKETINEDQVLEEVEIEYFKIINEELRQMESLTTSSSFA